MVDLHKPPFLKLTSDHDTPLLIRRDLLASVEGVTFGEKTKHPDHYGARVTILTIQGSECWWVLETPETITCLLGWNL